jgi:TonB family protein
MSTVKSSFLLLAVFAFFGLLSAADQPINFSGNWELDVQKSNLPGNVAGEKPAPYTIVHKGGEFQIRTVRAFETFTLDGKETVESMPDSAPAPFKSDRRITKATLEQGRVKVIQEIRTENGQLRTSMEREWSLFRDVKTLALSTIRRNPDSGNSFPRTLFFRRADAKPDSASQLTNPGLPPTSGSSGTGPYVVGNGVMAPVVLNQPLPPYTDEARRARVEGIALIQAVIRKDGTADSFKVLRGLGYGLDESAINIIATKWRFKPGTLNGAPVDVQASIAVSFKFDGTPASGQAVVTTSRSEVFIGKDLLEKKQFWVNDGLMRIRSITQDKSDPAKNLVIVGESGALTVDQKGKQEAFIGFDRKGGETVPVKVQKNEPLKFMNRAGGWQPVSLLDSNGRTLWMYPSEKGEAADSMAAGDLNRDGKLEFVVGMNASGGLHLLDTEGKEIWAKPAGNVFSVEVLDKGPGGAPEILHSDNGKGIVVRNADGETIRTINNCDAGHFSLLGQPPVSNGPLIVCNNGGLRLVDLKDTVVRSFKLPGWGQTPQGAVVYLNGPNSPPFYAFVRTIQATARRSDLTIFDSDGTLVYQEEFEASYLALSSLTEKDKRLDSLLVGENSRVWLYRMRIPTMAQDVDWKKYAEAETIAFQKGDYAEAARLLQSFLKAAENLHGPDAKEVVPALIKLIQAPTSMYRRDSAIYALGKIGPDAKGAVPVLIDLLGDGNVLPEKSSRLSPADLKQNARVLRSQVVFVLGKIGPAEGVVPALIALLKNKSLGVQSGAASALAEIGADAKEAIPALIAALKDADAAVSSNAATALNKIDPESKLAVPALIALLKDKSLGAESQNLVALKFAVIGRKAVPALIDALKDSGAQWQSFVIAVVYILAQDRFESRSLSGEARKKHFQTALAYLQETSNATNAALKKINVDIDEQGSMILSMMQSGLALAALESGEATAAKQQAAELLKNNTDRKSGFSGDRIYEANEILGRIALREGNMEDARRFLLRAINTPGSPGPYQPSMILARELLEKGEKAVVLEFLDLCGKFSKTPIEYLSKCKDEIMKGNIPQDATWR